MLQKTKELMDRLESNGFTSVEVPGFINDASSLVRGGLYPSIVSMNQELEDLGWGIGALDRVTYDLVIAAAKQNAST